MSQPRFAELLGVSVRTLQEWEQGVHVRIQPPWWDERMDLWVGDGTTATGADVIQRVPISVERIASAANRLPLFTSDRWRDGVDLDGGD